MLRYLTTVKLFGGAAAIIMALVLDTDSVAAKNLLVGPLTTRGQSIAGAVVCLGSTSTNRTHGPQTTGSGGTTFTNVSETQAIYVNVIAQGVGTAQTVMDPGGNPSVLVTVPGQFAVPPAVQSVCPAPPAPGAQPSPGVLHPIPPGQIPPGQTQRIVALAARANFFGNALYPVYSHPRCVNCHGRVDPPSGRNHLQTSAACSTCHSVQGWTNAGAPSFWAGSGTTARSWQDICNTVRNHPRSATRTGFANHVQNDPLIRWALAPTSIQQRPALVAAPGGRTAFVTNSLRWFDQGMQCGLQP